MYNIFAKSPPKPAFFTASSTNYSCTPGKRILPVSWRVGGEYVARGYFNLQLLVITFDYELPGRMLREFKVQIRKLGGFFSAYFEQIVSITETRFICGCLWQDFGDEFWIGFFALTLEADAEAVVFE